MTGSSTTRRLMLVGWDGATWDLLDPWMAAGYLPNLAKLVSDGVRAHLPSVPTVNSGPAWSNVVTGVNPGRHGIFHLTLQEPGTYTVRPMHGSDRRFPAIWQRLSRAGVPVVVVNVPVSYPADEVDGAMISGLDTPGDDAPGASWPRELLDEVRAQIGPYYFGRNVPGATMAGRLDAARDLLLESIGRRGRALELLLSRFPWRFCMVVFGESDWAQHHLWPRAGSAVECERLRAVFERLDVVLGELLATLSADDTCLLLSDHGGGLGSGAMPFVNPILAELSFLRFRAAPGRALRRRLYGLGEQFLPDVARRGLIRLLPRLYRRTFSELRLPAIDWSATRAYARTVGQEIWINAVGRRPEGTVAPAEYDRACREVSEALAGVTTLPSGRAAFRRVWRADEVYHGPLLDLGPDLILEMEEQEEQVEAVRVGDRVIERGMPAPHPSAGGHRREGILVLAGPEAVRGGVADGIRLEDITPTALYLLDQAIPAGLDGRVAVQLLTDEAVAGRPPREEPDPLVATATDSGLGSADEEVVLERLRTLGYIE